MQCNDVDTCLTFTWFTCGFKSAYWCLQAAELRPFSVVRMRRVAAVAISLCTCLYLGVSLGTAALFGESTQADVLHNYTVMRFV